MTTSLAERVLTLYFLLLDRADLQFRHHITRTNRQPAGGDQVDWDPRIPEDFRLFAREVSYLNYEYLGPEYADGEPIFGGINLSMSAGPGDLARPEWVPTIQGTAPPVDLWLFCDVPECWNGESTNLALLPDGAAMMYVFENPRWLGSLTDYLTLGARRGFVANWPNLNPALHNTPAERLAALRAHSLDEKTPQADVFARLRALGIDDVHAQDLWNWIGSDLTLYLRRN